MAKVEFFYDYSSPWTYLAFTKIEGICQKYGATLEWRPILVGGIFNTINPSVYEFRERGVPAKTKYYAKDLQDWARFYGLTIKSPPSVFPVNSVKALRGALVALEHPHKFVPYSYRVFAAYWGEDRDISKDEVLRGIVEQVGLDLQEYFDKINRQEYKDRLRANTEEVMARGGFGTPTMFVNGSSMFFGNDRLVLLEEELRRGQKGG
ncbi:MAG: 2-hydroxychromene-2-carboxylate isomerase [Deltaproteobacteria bacterium]|nr:MAG: 2-hydroxychromene-2-carboxylate isomerase [Deltaproteobacteria bacterium]